MRVNSTFISFFTNRLVMGSGIPIAIVMVTIAVFFIASSFTKHSNRDVLARRANLIIREIGHRLLLQAGDSTSRVLPVTEIGKGNFLLGFENEFVFFSHDSLMALSEELFSKTEFPSGYTVMVHECLKTGIVYGFQINSTSPDIRACKGRNQLPGCYTIEFAFPDLYENEEQKNIKQKKSAPKKAENGHQTEELTSFKVDRHEAHLKREEFNDDPKNADSIPIAIAPEESKTTTLNYPLIVIVYSGMLLLLIGTLLIGRFRKTLTPLSVKNQQPNAKESVPELPALGKFLFDVKYQRLLPAAIGMGSEVISLTDKECKVLELLHNNFGELIPRETLMQKVWINEGVITGRSLDMFVSKLRKKLSRDPELRITNVHGKGYKLEISGIQNW